jgi:hypothetical protein
MKASGADAFIQSGSLRQPLEHEKQVPHSQKPRIWDDIGLGAYTCRLTVGY